MASKTLTFAKVLPLPKPNYTFIFNLAKQKHFFLGLRENNIFALQLLLKSCNLPGVRGALGRPQFWGRHPLCCRGGRVAASFPSSLPVTVGWRQDFAQPCAPACSHRFGPQACIKSSPELWFLLLQTGGEPPCSSGANLRHQPMAHTPSSCLPASTISCLSTRAECCLALFGCGRT